MVLIITLLAKTSAEKISLARYMKVSLVVATFTMLVDIETFLLDSLVNTETTDLLDTPEEDDTCQETNDS